MKTSTQNPLNTLVQTLNDGIELYIAASAKVEFDHIKVVFAEMIETRKFALAYLQPYVMLETGAPELGHTFGGVLHRVYNKILDSEGGEHHQSLMQLLELVEDETLKAMHNALQKTNNIMVLSVIKQLLPHMESARANVLALEVSLAA